MEALKKWTYFDNPFGPSLISSSLSELQLWNINHNIITGYGIKIMVTLPEIRHE